MFNRPSFALNLFSFLILMFRLFLFRLDEVDDVSRWRPAFDGGFL